MIELTISDYYKSDEIAIIAGVNGVNGLQSGIFVNDDDKIIILLQKNTSPRSIMRYPNVWDEDEVGILHYCGTNKGQIKEIRTQNLQSRLNRHVNMAVYPIHVFSLDPYFKQYTRYMYLGEFSRAKEYDKIVEVDGKNVYSFGLRSKNVDRIHNHITEIISSFRNKN